MMSLLLPKGPARGAGGLLKRLWSPNPVRGLSTSCPPLGSPRVCVVGSGPAGFYTAQRLLRSPPAPPDLRVDILERLPVPFGLVRFGVAPDHPEVKNVESTFTKVAEDPRVRFFGNVSVGQDVSVAELRRLYDVVVLSYGAAKDRKLNIPGENLANVVSARSFVGFYNGLPEEAVLDVDLKHDSAAVVGLGNVALDVARILLTPIDDLRKTDITERALAALAESRVRRVYVVGRRGPVQVAFTIKELREMVHIPGCRPVFGAGDFAGVRELTKELQRPRKRLTELLVKSALDPPTPKQQELWGGAGCEREWHLKLLRTPLEIMTRDGRTASGLKLGVNELDGPVSASEGQSVIETGRTETLDCGLVLTSIGYQSVRVDAGVPFDEKKGVIPNVNGRVETEPGLYCSGWLATGPRGVINDTMREAHSVGSGIVKDLEEGRVGVDAQRPGGEGLERLLKERQVKMVDFVDWQKIDEKEKEWGVSRGKPREKITDVNKIISAVGDDKE